MQEFILVFAVYVYMFLFGSIFGWVLELFFRRFFSRANPERKWINPGFLNGPYLPIYGFGLCLLFTVSSLCLQIPVPEIMRNIITIMITGIGLTLIEYIAGVIFIKHMHMKLWDYSHERGNIGGIICPKFSVFWTVLGAVYLFVLHPRIFNMLYFLASHIEYSFFVGIVFGIFIVDCCYSMQLANKIKEFAAENELIIKYEELKRHIRKVSEEKREKVRFMLSFSSNTRIAEHLKEYKAKLDELRQK